ncbi:hypothetical protein BCR39DRAFT_558115 [Naematelia encephala]|uniref:Uncharacterized protein n=1 Tax=Naematelia encephala TaxID=71784 RepID=A0A1Y2B9X5_9TREE|nr:hypothetical protein BCR39DRAFT_558115 [Naematelia encephala]
MSSQYEIRSISPLLPLDIRLSTLEHLTRGSSSHASSSSTKPITRRIQEIESTLEQLSQASESLKRLLLGYAQYRPLLTLNESQEAGDNLENELIPDEVRITVLLEAAEDIIQIEKNLREVEILETKGAQGSGQLEEILPLSSNLAERKSRAKSRAKELERVNRDVRALLSRYNDLTSTASDLFLDLHQRLEIMEEIVASNERARKRELQGRF